MPEVTGDRAFRQQSLAGSEPVRGAPRTSSSMAAVLTTLPRTPARLPCVPLRRAHPARHPGKPPFLSRRPDPATRPGPARHCRLSTCGRGQLHPARPPEGPGRGAAYCARPALPAGLWTAAWARWWSATPRLAAPRTATAGRAAAPIQRPPSWTTPAPDSRGEGVAVRGRAGPRGGSDSSQMGAGRLRGWSCSGLCRLWAEPTL